jgi:hypothetical protein
MLLFLFGKDESLAYAKAKSWKDKILKEKKISESVLFVEKNIESEDFATLAVDISMFGDIFAYFIKFKKDDLLSETQIVDFISSPNLFAVVSNNEELKNLVQECGARKPSPLERAASLRAGEGCFIEIIQEPIKEFFPSHFVEALQKKDKKNAWKFFLELSQEKPGEEIYGVCIFAYKSLYAAAKFEKNNSLSGIKDFPFNNAKRNLKQRKTTPNPSLIKEGNYSEIENIYFNLLKVLPECRSKNIDLSIGIEKWILEN